MSALLHAELDFSAKPRSAKSQALTHRRSTELRGRLRGLLLLLLSSTPLFSGEVAVDQAIQIQPFVATNRIIPSSAVPIEVHHAEPIDPVAAQTSKLSHSKRIDSATGATFDVFISRKLHPKTGKPVEVIRSQRIDSATGKKTGVIYATRADPITHLPADVFHSKEINKETGKPIDLYVSTQIDPGTRAAVAMVYARRIDPITGQPSQIVYARKIDPVTHKLVDGLPSTNQIATATAPLEHVVAPALKTSLVEPLSNGIYLSMNSEEIVQKFGSPTDKTWDNQSFGYESFFVICGGQSSGILHLTLKRGVQLNSGIGVGSTRQAVQAVFGKSDSVTWDQYKLYFSYDRNGKLDQIKIDPANREFADYRGPISKASRSDVGQASLAGVWWCVAPSWSSGSIELKADGSYVRSSGGSGHYVVKNGEVLFDSGLKAWNGGRAQLQNGNLIFEWTNPDGSMNYFAFVKGRP